MSNNLKAVRKVISVSYDSLESVNKAYVEYVKTIPSDATNITSVFEAQQEDYSDYYRPVLEISYYVPKTEEDIRAEYLRKRNLETQERAHYLELKKKFGND